MFLDCKIGTSDGYLVANVVYSKQNQKNVLPLVIIAHGLAGYKEEPMLQCVQDCFLKQGYAVLVYDARHGLGESSGNLEKACFSEFIVDLNSIIDWAKQHLESASFILVGHSLGAGACLYYATKHPNEIAGMITLSAVYNGELLKESYLMSKPEFMVEWQRKKLIYRERPNLPNKNGYISIRHLDDACQYAVEQDVNVVKCPVLIICGDHDVSSTVSINERLCHSFEGNAELHIISNCGHTYSKTKNQTDLKKVVSEWISVLFESVNVNK